MDLQDSFSEEEKGFIGDVLNQVLARKYFNDGFLAGSLVGLEALRMKVLRGDPVSKKLSVLFLQVMTYWEEKRVPEIEKEFVRGIIKKFMLNNIRG